MPESLDWWAEHDPTAQIMNPTHLTYPEILCVTVLPDHIKNRITEKFNQHIKNTNNAKIANALEYIKNFMNSKDDTHLLADLKKYLEGTDKYRNQNFFESYPQFSDIFKYV